jgi:hypothetical protein
VFAGVRALGIVASWFNQKYVHPTPKATERAFERLGGPQPEGRKSPEEGDNDSYLLQFPLQCREALDGDAA